MTKKKKASSSTGIVSWEDMMKSEAKEVAKVERPSVGRISLQSGVMTYQDVAVENNELICIVADAIHEQVYYDKPFEPGVVNPPACFAYGILEPGAPPLTVHPDVPERDYENWGNCKTCQMNQWRKPPGKGKPCSERRRLAILPWLEDPKEYENAEIAVLSLPVMSVKNWSNYVNTVAATEQRPSWGVLTKVSVRPDAKSQFRVFFDMVSPLSEEYLGAVHPRREMCRNTLLVPFDLSPTEEEQEQTDSGKY